MVKESYKGFVGMKDENRLDQYANMRLKAIDWFMRGYSKAESMRKAGYSESVCKTDTGSVFGRQDVQDEIKRRQDKAAQKAQVDVNWIVGRLKEIASANLGDIIVVEPNGDARFDFTQMTPEMRAALAEFSIDDYTEGRGEGSQKRQKIKVKFGDQLRALEMLGKHLGMFADRIKLEGDADLIERLYAGRARVGSQETDDGDV